MTNHQARVEQHRTRDRLARFLGVLAIVISVGGFWLSYTSALPALSAKIELLDPLLVEQPVHLRVMLDNNGRTTAKGVHPTLNFKFARADVGFAPTYDVELPSPAGWTPTTSDLTPGEHATLYSVGRLRLEHDHDVNAVLSGDWNFFVYGKIPYRDIFYLPHEYHFCGVYRQVPGAEPLKFTLCSSYNETN